MKIKNENEVITIEQKAQRYDEALEKAKTLYGSSEDEKVRKEIIRFIRMEVEDEIVGNKWLAWLGKQKGNIGGISSNSEWSKEDEEALEMAIIALEDMYDDDTTNTTYGGHYMPFDMAANRLKSLKDRVGCEANCTTIKEWSEEDKKIINGLIDSLTRISLNTRTDSTSPNYTFYKEIDWLKSLRPQNHWKPSEGDIIILEKLIKGELEPKVFQATLHGILEQLKKLKEE